MFAPSTRRLLVQATRRSLRSRNSSSSKNPSKSSSASSSPNSLLIGTAGVTAVLLAGYALSTSTGQRSSLRLHQTSQAPKAVADKAREVAATIPSSPVTAEKVQKDIQHAEIPLEAAQNEEEHQRSAYNPETGEIDWDCPCLGGMAHGVCGEQFKNAFSCFIHSQEEQKGVDCIDAFRAMQDCFREHPDVYGEELAVTEKEDDTWDLIDEAEEALKDTVETVKHKVADVAASVKEAVTGK